MSIITVNGTSIQKAIDSAQMRGDTIDLKAGGYDGRIVINGKAVSIVSAEGAAVLDGGLLDGFANIDAVNLPGPIHLSGLVGWDAGALIRFRGPAWGSVVEFCHAPRVSRMIRNTKLPTNDDNGGNGLQLSRTKDVTFRDCILALCRAMSFDYKLDGGGAEIYGSQNILFQRCEVWDSVNITEFGADAAGPINSGISFIDCAFHGRAFPTFGTSIITDATSSVGMRIRAIDGLLVQGCTFDQIDYFAALLTTKGGFTGPVRNVHFIDNEIRLFPGMNRYLTMDGIDLTQGITFDRNRVYPYGTDCIAQIDGTRYVSDRTSLPWLDPNGYWGPEETTPAYVLRDSLTTAQQTLATAQQMLAAERGVSTALRTAAQSAADDVAHAHDTLAGALVSH